MTLATDGFARSDTRENLRRVFEIDAEPTMIAALHALAKKQQVLQQTVAKAIKDLNLDPEKAHPAIVSCSPLPTVRPFPIALDVVP